MLPLAELLGLCGHLATIPSLLFFHENQLTYPVREEWSGPRDHHFGFTQLLSALAATQCVFNSDHNRTSFLAGAAKLFRALPDAVHPSWLSGIEAKSRTAGLPLSLPDVLMDDSDPDPDAGPIILWNHRWEHDKNPARLLGALRALREAEGQFRLAVCGKQFQTIPEALTIIEHEFSDNLVHFGYAESLPDYHALLRRAHIAVSTADHEFFGVSMLEAAHFGARPLVPDCLSYPEIFPSEYRYGGDDDLSAQLTQLCAAWANGHRDLRRSRHEITNPHRGAALDRWRRLLGEVSRG